MARLLASISLILAIVLFPPASLALVSNNAVPGDATYPIKRILEDGIFAVVSLNPTSKAWFAAARSDRRFKEFTTLIAQGKKGGETLNELVEQTQVAAGQIDQVKDESQKQKLIQQLSDSIQKYDQGLQQLSTPSSLNPTPVSENAVPAPNDQIAAVPQITAVPTESGSAAKVKPTAQPQPKQTPEFVVQPAPRPTSVPPRPVLTPAPTSVGQPIATATPTSMPTLAPRPTQVPTPIPTAAPTQNPTDTDRQRQIDEARRQLEEIRRRLGVQEQRQEGSEHKSQNVETSQQSRQENRQNDKKDESKDKPKRGRD